MMIPIFHQIQIMEEAAVVRTALVDRKKKDRLEWAMGSGWEEK